MKPMIVIPPKVMSAEDLKMLRDNGICVVESEKPELLKFIDPIPCVNSRTQIEDAAIRLSRRILRGDIFRDNRRDFALMFVDCLVKGTSLDPEPLQSEREKQIFDEAKAAELRRLAQEEARQERKAASEARLKSMAVTLHKK